MIPFMVLDKIITDNWESKAPQTKTNLCEQQLLGCNSNSNHHNNSNNNYNYYLPIKLTNHHPSNKLIIRINIRMRGTGIMKMMRVIAIKEEI